jgi:cyclopropane fatty-acyl-phospholipid synthase-like methyltransferase
MNAAITENDIVNYYDQCQVDYEIVWHLNSQMCMHYGYWDDTTPTLRSALRNMNAKLASFAEIKPNEKILDAGCGVGGSSFFLSKNFRCEVEGITLSKQQVSYATQKAEEFGLQHTINFSVRNYLDTKFPDNYFDVVWAIESVCHAVDKKLFLEEAFRVLKKGGRLVVADFFSNSEVYNNNQKSWLQKWANTWAVPSFECLDLFTTNAAETGFQNIHSRNITSHIMPTAKRLYYCFIPGVICDNFLRIFGKRTPLNKANVHSTLYQYKSLKAEMWSYHFFKATK